MSKVQNQACSDTTSPDIKTHTKQKELRIDKEHKRERKKHLHESKRHKLEYQQDVKNVYFVDKHRDKGNNTANCSRTRPFYDIRTRSIGFIKHKQRKKNMFQRYYFKNIDFVGASKKKEIGSRRKTEKETPKQNEEISTSELVWCKNIEEEQKNKVQEFNKLLAEDPHNVKLWLQYIDFQVVNKLMFLF